MTTMLEAMNQAQAREDYDQADAERLAILNNIEEVKTNPKATAEDIRELAHRAFDLAKRGDLYGLEAEMLVDEAAALAAPVDPTVMPAAHEAIEKIYADYPELARSPDNHTRAAKELAIAVLEQTVQTSIELSDDDTIPNLPVEAIVQTAIEAVTEDDTQPMSHAQMRAGWRNKKRFQEEQRQERLANATADDLREEDDAVKVDPAALFDDEDDVPIRHVA
jgi:hypothetical protein